MKTMKKLLYSVMLLALAAGYTSCEDDNDDNPVLVPATEFVLNTPTFVNQQIDLASGGTLSFTCSQPNCGFPLQYKYSLQFSITGNFTVSVDEADASEGALTADYQSGEESSSCTLTIPAFGDNSFARGLQQLAKWPEGLVPATQKVYVRVKAEPKATTPANVEQYIVYSNVIELNVTPVYVELKNAPVVMWYLVGNHFGAKWGNVPGETALPMFIIPDYSYDKKTGKGELEYYNYFITGDYDNTAGNESSTAGFKIQPDDFNWDLGMTGDNGVKGKIIYRNKGGDGGHIVAPEEGYYRLVMNTDKLEAKFEKQDISPKVLSTMGISGAFNDWGETPMLPYNSEGIENHAWYVVVDAPAEGGFKFRPDGAWAGHNKGKNEIVNCGIAKADSGEDIGLAAGSWLIIYCDINGEFSVFAK